MVQLTPTASRASPLLPLLLLLSAGVLLPGITGTGTSRSPSPSSSLSSHPYPTRVLAGVTVIDTPLVRAAEAYARAHGAHWTYKHVMRSWLYGVLILAHDEDGLLASRVDPEVHAVACLLHDLGWERVFDGDGEEGGSELVSKDRRFEVDGAIAAREFVEGFFGGRYVAQEQEEEEEVVVMMMMGAHATHEHQHAGEVHGGFWDEHAVQLMWDAIALHTDPGIAMFKEPAVKTVHEGILLDFINVPLHGITADEMAAVAAEFPKDDLKAGTNETNIWLCQTKPSTTYDNWLQSWGDEYVADYKSEGNRIFDTLYANL